MAGSKFSKSSSRKKGRFAKRMYKRRARSAVWKNNISTGIGFPKKMCMTHKYHEVVGLTSTTGVVGTYKFQCNGMYDPNTTGTGHQPMYYDQMAAIYNHWTVIGSKIIIKITPTTGSSVPFYITLAQNDDSVATGGIDANAEYGSGRRLLFGASTDSVKTMSNKWSAKKTFGGSVLGNDNLQGSSAGVDPSEKTYWHINLQAADQVSTQSVIIDVLISYIAVWEEPKDIIGS